MPTRVLLEGPAIEPLLAQVREEYGSGVRIISADKVRSGGFGGFFAKQHYELSVEVPDATDDRKTMPQRKAPAMERPAVSRPARERPAPPKPPAREEAAHTLEQLLERAESRDRIVPDEPPAEKPRPKPAPAERRTERDAGIENLEAINRRDLSDNAAAFAELMAGLDAANHIATAAPHRPSPRTRSEDKPETPTVRPFRPAAAAEAPVNAPLRPLPPVPSLAELMGGLGVTEPKSPAPQPSGPSSGPASGRQAGPASEPPAGPASEPPAGPGMTAADAFGLNQTLPPPKTPPTPPAAPEPTSDATTPAPGTDVALRPMRSDPVHTDPVVSNLVSVGMPELLAAQITGGDTYAGVLTALASRPAAPAIPDGSGEILVLAGDLTYALPIARNLLDQAGLDPTHLLLAGTSAAGTGLHSSRVLHNAKEAGARSDKLQNSTSAWVVVMDARVGATDPIWVNDMCDAIGATALWAVVDATRKTADTARHLRALGDVEALVVHSVELTADPATVLGLDLPIFSLDGKPATPHAWAAMLCARIAADVTPQIAAPRRQVRSAR
ncbi:hypothetical protein [Actinoplanes sp. NBRC 103695]|uniref:hypothetical protein n=1 Tax=Actinoplanes sp. NBRC 103695 TaxID=3032202 RepID=UPI0024A3B7B0|nr:hypothetical protein [Actinoplanes sp. NBRC 103695]GLY96875.1 hypothetical protein Acsp02_41290 [Actinoplanes sp. NBRC 103695]